MKTLGQMLMDAYAKADTVDTVALVGDRLVITHKPNANEQIEAAFLEEIKPHGLSITSAPEWVRDFDGGDTPASLLKAASAWVGIGPCERDRITAVLCKELGIEKEYQELSRDGRFLDFLVRWHIEISSQIHQGETE